MIDYRLRKYIRESVQLMVTCIATYWILKNPTRLHPTSMIKRTVMLCTWYRYTGQILFTMAFHRETCNTSLVMVTWFLNPRFRVGRWVAFFSLY